MTIDEAIKHAEEVAEKYCEKVEEGLTADDFCDSCASEHRQLAEWLNELKALKNFAKYVAESVMEEDFKENSDFYAEVFCRKLHKMGFIEAEDDKWVLNNEEVNADDK